MTRIILAFIILIISNTSQAQYFYCPSPVAADFDADGIDDIGLFTVRDDGTISTGKSDEFAEVVVAASLDPDSSCQIDAVLYAYDAQGTVLGSEAGIINSTDFLVWPRPSGVVERLTAAGHMTGCTANEASHLTVSVNHLKSKGGVDEVLETERLPLLYFRQSDLLDGAVVSSGVINGSRHLQIDPLCPGRAATIYGGDGSGLLELNWDFESGITSPTSTHQAALVVLVTPRLVTPGCNEASSNYRVKVKVTFKLDVADSTGEHYSDAFELDADNPYRRVMISNGSTGERVYQLVNASAETDGCSMGQPSDLMVYLELVDTVSGTTLSRTRLPARTGRNPQTGAPIMFRGKPFP